MNELEMLATLIAEEMVLSIDSRFTRAFDRLMAPEEIDSPVFAAEEQWEFLSETKFLTYTARA